VSDCRDILISLAPAYTRAILDGKKTVELRRRRLRVGNGTRVWIYSKTPAACIEAMAYVESIHEGNPDTLWGDFGDAAGISRAEFDRYFAGCSRGWALTLTRVRALTPALNLNVMRSEFAGFHPPQFFKRLSQEEIKGLLLTRPKTPTRHRPAPMLG
jgi:predicted transcriptional regulator